MKKLCGLIPAAGKGTRAYPYTKSTPKSLLEINGMPNLQRLILLMRDSMNIKDIYIVIGYHGEVIKDYLGDGSQLDVNLTLISNNHLDKGLAYSVLLGKKFIDDYFLVMLSDECYVNSNHNEILSFPYDDSLATITFKKVDDAALIKKNYSVKTVDDRVEKLIEKPTELINNYLGLGTFLFSPQIFKFLEDAFNESGNDFVDLVSLVDKCISEGETVRPFEIKGNYVNINDRDSLQLAKYYVREKLVDNISTSLLISSEGNEEDITYTINQYKKSEYINNIYVLLPHKNSLHNEVSESGVQIITCPPGIELYGEKLKYGLEQMEGDIFIITVANYSFSYRDIPKLFAYLKEADMVLGTRTTRQLIQLRSHMKGIVRFANVLLAKFIELLWWNFECRFTDVGCTYRAFWKSSFYKIKDNLNSKGPEFSIEMKLELLRARDRIIEIPINYYGKSYSLYQKYQNVNSALRMFFLIIKKSVAHYVKDR